MVYGDENSRMSRFHTDSMQWQFTNSQFYVVSAMIGWIQSIVVAAMLLLPQKLNIILFTIHTNYNNESE